VLFVALLCGFIRGNDTKQKIQTEETLMLNPFAPLVRIPSTIVLFGLLVLSVVTIKNIVTTEFQGIAQEGNLYKRSPNCVPLQDSSEVDPSLSPCQNVMATVIAKPQNTVSDFRGYRNYPKTHLLLTLQNVNGQSQTVGDIQNDMWNSIHVGDQVTVEVWRGQIKSVSTNGYSSSIIDKQKANASVRRLWPWIVMALVSSSLLSILWGTNRNRSLLSPF